MPRIKIVLLVGVVLLLFALALAVLGLPSYARGRAIAIAGEQGVELTVEGARLGFFDLHLLGVTARIRELPGAEARAADVEVTLAGLSPDALSVSGVEVTLQGDARLVAAALTRYRAGHSLATAAGGTLKRISVQSTHVVWQKPAGEGSHLEGSDVSGEVACHASAQLGDEAKMIVGTLRATLAPGKEVGPWQLEVDRAPTGLRTRLSLDPTDPAAATLVSERDAHDASSLTLNLRKMPLKKLGISPAILGLQEGDEPTIEASVKLGFPSALTAEGSIALTVEKLRVPGVNGPTHARVNLAWSGDPTRPIPLQAGTFAFGPFEGSVHGTVLPFEGGVRLDLSLESRPVPCSALASGTVQDAVGGALGASLRALAEAGGFTKAVTGNAELSGIVFLDTRDMKGARLTLTPKTTCGLSIFSGPGGAEQAK